MSQAAMVFPGRLRPECRKELGSDVQFFQASLDDAAKIALDLERTGVRVIISRGGTADVIRQVVSIPVVNCEVSTMDLMDTLLEIREEIGDELRAVALIIYHDMSYITDKLERLLGMKIYQYSWREGTELEHRVLQAKETGVDAIVGAQLSVRLAEKHGLKGYLMQVGPETIKQAVNKAREILEIRKKDLSQLERIKSLINFAHEGIISMDNLGIIDLANPEAAKILGKNQHHLIGVNAKSIFVDWVTSAVDEIELGQIANVDEKHIIYNRVPLLVDGQNIGGVVTFIDSENIVENERKIRTTLHAKGLVAKYRPSDIVGRSRAIMESIRKTKLYASAESTVLIAGETGTGKELFAHSLHFLSKRRNRPFVAINCAALPENLLESELFGFEEGSFTGARKGGRAGLFEIAHEGTLFLDEIAEMHVRLQSRLLRAIQEKEVMRLGGDKIVPVDVRVIVATNRDLKRAVEKHMFRSDLYFRLNVLNIRIPPLRERLEDIPLLVEHFCRTFSQRFGHRVPPPEKDTVSMLKGYHWPGNVRELENLVHRYALLVDKVRDRSLLQRLFEEQIIESRENLPGDEITVRVGSLSEMLDQLYSTIFRLAGENRTRAAQIMGVNRMTIAKWLARKVNQET